MQVGESKAEMELQNSSRVLLRRIMLCPRYVKVDAQEQWAGLAEGKGKFYAWGVTTTVPTCPAHFCQWSVVIMQSSGQAREGAEVTTSLLAHLS